MAECLWFNCWCLSFTYNLFFSRVLSSISFSVSGRYLAWVASGEDITPDCSPKQAGCQDVAIQRPPHALKH